MADAETTKPQQRGLVMWKPGQSGNPAGRPKGTRHKLGETFLGDLMEDWETHGQVAIAEMREKNPGDYVKVVASIVPKEIHHTVEDYGTLDDDDLHARLRAAVARLNRGKDAGGGSRAQGEPLTLPH